MRLGRYFIYREVIHSPIAIREGIKNEPTDVQLFNSRRLVETCLDPLRGFVGPYHSESWFRTHRLNDLVFGAKKSFHLHGCAHDGWPLDLSIDLADVMDWLHASKLPFDKAIYEYGRWIHLQCPMAETKPRRTLWMTFGAGDGYERWDPTDVRIARVVRRRKTN